VEYSKFMVPVVPLMGEPAGEIPVTVAVIVTEVPTPTGDTGVAASETELVPPPVMTL
jgi:hypothetical protein